MSRPILSYADLEPSTSTKGVSSSFLSSGAGMSGEPPRKRIKTNETSTIAAGSSAGLQKSVRNTTESYVLAEYNSVGNLNNNQRTFAANSPVSPNRVANKAGRNGKSPKRPGNPSGVHWTQHWDSQLQNEGQMGGLSYDQSQSIPPPVAFHFLDDKRSVQHANVRNAHSRTVPSKPKNSGTFIGPMIPTTSHYAHTDAPNFRGGVSPISGEGSKKRKKRAKKPSNADNSNSFRDGTNDWKKRQNNKPRPSMNLGQDWDDSALIDAWNAAEAQYREMNGGKKWSLESVKHSILWHDTLPSDRLDQHSNGEISVHGYDDDQDETIGDHDPDLYEEETAGDHDAHPAHAFGGQPPSANADLRGENSLDTPLPSSTIPTATIKMQAPFSLMEEAFQKAKDASYALGYWTAVYNHNYQAHMASTKDTQPATVVGEIEPDAHIDDEDEDEDEDEEEEDGEETGQYDFAGTQR